MRALHILNKNNTVAKGIHIDVSWSKQNNLTLNLDKTTCTLFTPDHVEYKSNLDLRINNTTHGNAPKGSGHYLRSKTHIQHTHSRHLSTRTQTTTHDKTLTATVWGEQKEAFMATYKAVIKPALEYASSI